MRIPHVPREHTIDYAGAVALSVGVTAVLLASAWGGTSYAWDSPEVIAAAVIGVAGLAALRDHRAPRDRAAAPARPLPGPHVHASPPPPRC